MNENYNNQNLVEPEYLNAGNNINKMANNKYLIAIIVIVGLLILSIGLLTYYLISVNSPVVTYRSMLKSAVNEIYKITEIDDKFRSTIGIDMDLKLEEDILDEEILDIFNETTMDIELQWDRVNEKAVLKLDSEYDKETLLEGNIYLNKKDNELYLYSKELLDKYIQMESDELDAFDGLFEEITKIQRKNIEKSKKIIIKELEKVITKDDCYKEDGYHIFKISSDELIERLERVVENLKENKEFLSCFEDEDIIVSSLDSITFSSNGEDIEYFVKKSLFNKVEEMKVEVADMTGIISFENKNIEYEIKSDGQKIICGTIVNEKEKDENNMELVMNITDFGKLTLNVTTSYQTKYEMDEVVKSKVVSIEKLDEDAKNELMENLENSVLYEFVSLIPSDDYENDYDYDNNDDYNNSTQTRNDTIQLYGDSKKIYLKLPSEYELDYSSDTYKSYSNGDINVVIYANYGETASEYLNDLSSIVSSYYQYYQNVNLSSSQFLNTNNRDFYYKDFYYEYQGYGYLTKYYTKYIYTQINYTYGLVIEVSTTDNDIMTSELYNLLNISYY